MKTMFRLAAYLAAAAGAAAIIFLTGMGTGEAGMGEDAEYAAVPDGPLTLDVVLKRTYLDGETSEERVKETIWALEDFWAAYEDWQLVDMDEEKLIFAMKIDDISPMLKMNGYFGLTDDGFFSIYNGKPAKAKVIQSFFQIDMEKLEGRQQNELKDGVPITTKETYTAMIEKMRNFEKKSLQ